MAGRLLQNVMDDLCSSIMVYTGGGGGGGRHDIFYVVWYTLGRGALYILMNIYF